MESASDRGTEQSVLRTKIRGLICRGIEKAGMLKCLGGRKTGWDGLDAPSTGGSTSGLSGGGRNSDT